MKRHRIYFRCHFAQPMIQRSRMEEMGLSTNNASITVNVIILQLLLFSCCSCRHFCCSYSGLNNPQNPYLQHYTYMCTHNFMYMYTFRCHIDSSICLYTCIHLCTHTYIYIYIFRSHLGSSICFSTYIHMGGGTRPPLFS